MGVSVVMFKTWAAGNDKHFGRREISSKETI